MPLQKMPDWRLLLCRQIVEVPSIKDGIDNVQFDPEALVNAIETIVSAAALEQSDYTHQAAT